MSWWLLFQLEGFLRGELGFGQRCGRVVPWNFKGASHVELLVSWVISEAETWGQMILNYSFCKSVLGLVGSLVCRLFQKMFAF